MKLKKGSAVILSLLAGVILMMAQCAYADTTVVYKITSRDGGGTQTIHYRDKQHVRLDMGSAGARKISFLKLGDKIYSINGKVVQDLSQLAKMMASMGMAKKGNHKTSLSISYKDTGRAEIIAGIHGKVYRFVDNGESHEVVLGQNKNLRDAVQGMVDIIHAATVMMPLNDTNRIQQDATIKEMALLRLDNEVRLQSVSNAAIPVAIFKLPSAPQQMGGFGGLMKSALGR